MSAVLRGVIHGKTIELTEKLEGWEGQEVDLLVVPVGTLEPRLELTPKRLPGPPPGWRPGATSKVAGILAEDATKEEDKVFEQIRADFRAAKWREL